MFNALARVVVLRFMLGAIIIALPCSAIELYDRENAISHIAYSRARCSSPYHLSTDERQSQPGAMSNLVTAHACALAGCLITGPLKGVRCIPSPYIGHWPSGSPGQRPISDESTSIRFCKSIHPYPLAATALSARLPRNISQRRIKTFSFPA